FLLILVAICYAAAVAAARLKPRATGEDDGATRSRRSARLQPSGTVLLLLFFVVACASNGSTPSAAAPQATPRVLYVTQSAGFKHDVLPLSAQILQSLGRESRAFDVTSTDDSAMVTRDALTRFDAGAFFTTGELPMSTDQRSALIDFVRSGKGFVGIHSATDTFYEWP